MDEIMSRYVDEFGSEVIVYRDGHRVYVDRDLARWERDPCS